jgi:antitoxin PrlF
MEKEARVTSKGQVTIPKEVRRALRIRAGDTLVFETDEEGVRIRPRRPANVFVEYEGIWREGEGETAEEINAWIRELRDADA